MRLIVMGVFLSLAVKMANAQSLCTHVFEPAAPSLTEKIQKLASARQRPLISYDVRQVFDDHFKDVDAQVEAYRKSLTDPFNAQAVQDNVKALSNLNERMVKNLEEVNKNLKQCEQQKSGFFKFGAKTKEQIAQEIQTLAAEVQKCYASAQACHVKIKENIESLLQATEELARLQARLKEATLELKQLSDNAEQSFSRYSASDVLQTANLKMNEYLTFIDMLNMRIEFILSAARQADLQFEQFNAMERYILLAVSNGAPKELLQLKDKTSESKTSDDYIADRVGGGHADEYAHGVRITAYDRQQAAEREKKVTEVAKVLGKEWAEELVGADPLSFGLSLQKRLNPNFSKIAYIPLSASSGRYEIKKSKVTALFDNFQIKISDEQAMILLELWPRELEMIVHSGKIELYNYLLPAEKKIEFNDLAVVILMRIKEWKLSPEKKTELYYKFNKILPSMSHYRTIADIFKKD